MWNGTMFVDLDGPLNASSLLSASAELLVQYTKCTKRSFRWTRCSRYHCKDVHHCGKFWQQTNPPQLTTNSSNFSHLFLGGRKWLLKKYF